MIQLAHTVGAIKTFGLEDTQVKSSKKSVRERIQFNYDQIDFTVIGSERMGELFMEAFNTTNEHLIRTGVPKTDFFFDELEKIGRASCRERGRIAEGAAWRRRSEAQ